MEIQYVHVKTRAQFGKQCIFDDEGPTVDVDILPNRELMEDYIYRNPCHVGVQKSNQFAVHEVQTTSAMTKESGMSHTEGGWPKEMNPKDEEATARFRRRVEKDDNWPSRMKDLMAPIEHYVLQNNAVNIYDDFFDDMVTTELVLPLDARTVNVYEDPQTLVRPITHLSWSPDHGKRLAVSYCWMEFQREPGDLNPWSYIWDIENPNKAFMALKALCPSVTIEFNPRDPSMLISGLMSGQVCSWDIRTGNTPVHISHLQFSHRNPTNLALWINSKSNTEFFSASTGGAIKWWDLRKLREPTETLVMDLENPIRADFVRSIGVSSLQYEPTMGTKFMAGMENGVVVSGTRKGKNPQEKLALRFVCHDGPVASVDRNPFSTKNFLTVGGREAKIWAEDTREGNLVSSKQHRVPLTGGCWSTSRYSVFYVIDEDGTLEAYDVLVGMKSPVKTIHLCENGLTAIAPHEEGTLVAVGCDRGKVYLVESSEALTTNSRNDKALMTAYLDRCSRYEKAVDNRLKEVRLVQRLSEIQEQIDEPVSPVLPTKGKAKGAGKDVRVKDITNDKKPEDKASREAAPGGTEEKDKKSKMKIKKVKDNLISSGDPELADSELRYYEVIHKEMEKYAEIAALDEEGGEAVSAVASSPYATTETSTAARRRKHEDSKADKEVGGVKRGLEKKDDKDLRKQRKSVGGNGGGRAISRTEEIVIVRKSKHDTTTVHEKDQNTSKKMDELTGLERITEENDEETLTENEAEMSEKDMKKVKKKSKTRVEGEKRVTRKKHPTLEMEKPCTDYVCQPDVCCLDKTEGALDSGVKSPKSKSPVDRIDSEMKMAIEDMLAGLRKISLPNQLLPLMDEEPTREKPISEEKDAPPRILDEAAKIARREAREWRELVKQGTFGMPTKLQRREQMKSLTIDEILDESDYADAERHSELVDQASRSVERFSIDDEPSRESVNYATRLIGDPTKAKVKTARDCEPMALQFGAKEIRDIIGVPDAPIPSNQPKSDVSESRLSKRHDYPRISAAAMPKLKMKDDYSTK